MDSSSDEQGVGWIKNVDSRGTEEIRIHTDSGRKGEIRYLILGADFFTPLSSRSTADLPLGDGFFRLGAGPGGRQGGRSAEEACGAVPGKVCPHHGAQFDTRGPRPTPHCCGEFYASTLTWAHDSIGLSMIG